MNLSDLEEFAHIGYADGVSNIFVKGINALDINKRPIHCSDAKREVLYIKNNNEWIKETDDKPLIKSAIKRVAFKNIRQINDWVKENPDCKDTSTKQFDKYNKIVMNSMSGGTEQEQNDNIEKIVKNVTKAVAIDKYSLK
jgi:CRISPR/Cas system CSM-associated protein Csm4 (group 5 of RAMP superfamily)